jgi:hypothetical protein
MSWFVRIEETCAAFIERAFANMFPSDLEPAQIARKLVATMEARTQSVGNTMIAPRLYAVYINPVDYARLAPHASYLQNEWCALLSDVAARVGIQFVNGVQPQVNLREDAEVVAGAIDIEIENGERSGRAEVFALRLLKGMPGEQLYRISGATRVGRNEQSDIVLTDPSVSRIHALLDVRDGELTVRDEGSSNGTFVNGNRIAALALQPGDIIAFGKTEMRVEKA